jgi:uncharacterized 2Fe-2S/4Fe-4S cluster protein (DUF4445 family)
MTVTHKTSRTQSATVTFDPAAKVAQSLPAETLLDCARRAGVKISSVCGGRGICKSCIVHFTDGDIPAPSAGDRQFFSAHKLEQGWRRACQVIADADCGIHVPARSRAESLRHQQDGVDFWVQPDPVVHTFRMALQAPSLEDPRSDAKRLMAEINTSSVQQCHSMDIEVMRSLPQILRANDWCVQAVVRFGEVIAVQPGNTPLVGLAVDIGTSNIGVFLIDLRKGTNIASAGLENPQCVHGADVITRITAALQYPDKAREMQRLVIEAINETVASLCEKRHLQAEQIVDVVVAGNTAMHHLFLDLPVDKLGTAPFVAVMNDALDIKARDLKLHTAAGAYVHVMENIAGYVGGDHTAMLLGIRADEEARTVVALDIGTNTEISLLHEGKITCLSCPSGPALEGGHISSGMRAATGAIETVSINNDELQLTVIGDGPAVGLCGSAVVDCAAAFYRAGGINASGRIVEDYPLTTSVGKQRMFVLHDGDPDVVFTQDDVRAVQLAKGAVRAGIEILLNEAGLNYEQIDKIIIAGGFGAYIDVENTRSIGMLPDLPMDRFEQVGNAAGTGVQLALLSYPLRQQAQSLVSLSRYIELAGSSEFTSVFMKHIGFPPREPSSANNDNSGRQEQA